jgi:hypothetical protein
LKYPGRIPIAASGLGATGFNSNHSPIPGPLAPSLQVSSLQDFLIFSAS